MIRSQPVGPGFQGQNRFLEIDFPRGTQHQQRRIAMLDDPGVAARVDVDNGESGVADFALAAHRQRVNDGLGRLPDIVEAGGVLQRHGGGQRSQDIGFDPAAQTVGKHRDYPVFLADLLGEKDVAGNRLPVLGALAGVHLDKTGASGHPRRLPFHPARKTARWSSR
jgi:hypothetical protein